MKHLKQYIDACYLFFKGNQGNSKRKWEDSEVRAVERQMMQGASEAGLHSVHQCRTIYTEKRKLDCGKKLRYKSHYCLEKKSLCKGLRPVCSFLVLFQFSVS